MKKSFVAESLSDFFKPQKNHDLLYTGNVQQFFKTRHSSNICFVDDPAAGNENPTGDENNPPEVDSVLGGEDDPDGNEPGGKDGDDPDNKADEDDPDSDKDPDEKKESEDENEETGAPEKYELSIPEGMELDEKALEKFEPLFREANMTNEQASKFAEAYGEHVNGLVEGARTQVVESMQEQWVKQNKEWQGALQKNEEFGGAEFKENMNVAKSVLDRFGGTKEEIAEVRKALNVTGAGNHPAIVGLLFRVGKAMQDDKIHDNGSDNGGKDKTDLYPNSPGMN